MSEFDFYVFLVGLPLVVATGIGFLMEERDRKAEKKAEAQRRRKIILKMIERYRRRIL